MALLDLVRQRSEGCKANRGPGDTAPDWCWRFTTEEAAAEIGCNRTEVLADLKDAKARGLLDVRAVGFAYECRIPFEQWKAVNPDGSYVLPSIKRGPQLVKEERQSDDEPAEGDDPGRPAAAKTTERVEEFKVREGARSKKHRFDVPPSSFSVTVIGAAGAVSGVRQGTHLDLTVSVASSKVNELREKVGSTLPISGFPLRPGEKALPSSGDLLADSIRASTGLIVDPPGCRRIEKALNGTIPLPFYLEELAAAVADVPDPQPGLAVYVAEQKVGAKWRLSQKAGPAPPKKKSGVRELMQEI